MEPDQNTEKDDFAEFGSIKRSQTSAQDYNLNIQPSVNVNTKFSKKTVILVIIVLLILIGGGFTVFKSRTSLKKLVSTPTPTPSPVSTPVPTEAPKKTLNKSDWSFEVLNGSGESGLAKKIGDKIKELGYMVVKVGNADNQSLQKNQILVKKELLEKVDLVIADLKDIIKIASFGGELKDATASARIIIGKDSI